MRILYPLALACAISCCGCTTFEPSPQAAEADTGMLLAEPRGIVGEPCPAALAAKAYC